MSQLTDILMIGLVLVGGYYALSYMSQLQTTQGITTTTPGVDTTNIEFPIEESAFNRLGACANYLDSDEDETDPCEKECGKNGNAYDCNRCETACNMPNQHGRAYMQSDEFERCGSQGGVYSTSKECCDCHNKKMNGVDCCPGTEYRTPYVPPKPKSNISPAGGLCLSQGGVWSNAKQCCDCKNKKLSQVKCCAGTAFVPKKSTSKSNPKANKGLGSKHPLTAKQKNLPNKLNQCAGLTGQTYKNCVNSYAHAYLGSAFNRWGPGYSYRDMFEDRLIQSRVVPSPVDFQYESAKKPYYLGPISPERAALNKRFFANMAITIA